METKAVKYPYVALYFGSCGRPLGWKGIQVAWKPFRNVKPWDKLYQRSIFIPIYPSKPKSRK